VQWLRFPDRAAQTFRSAVQIVGRIIDLQGVLLAIQTELTLRNPVRDYAHRGSEPA